MTKKFKLGDIFAMETENGLEIGTLENVYNELIIVTFIVPMGCVGWTYPDAIKDGQIKHIVKIGKMP